MKKDHMVGVLFVAFLMLGASMFIIGKEYGSGVFSDKKTHEPDMTKHGAAGNLYGFWSVQFKFEDNYRIGEQFVRVGSGMKDLFIPLDRITVNQTLDEKAGGVVIRGVAYQASVQPECHVATKAEFSFPTDEMRDEFIRALESAKKNKEN